MFRSPALRPIFQQANNRADTDGLEKKKEPGSLLLRESVRSISPAGKNGKQEERSAKSYCFGGPGHNEDKSDSSRTSKFSLKQSKHAERRFDFLLKPWDKTPKNHRSLLTRNTTLSTSIIATIVCGGIILPKNFPRAKIIRQSIRPTHGRMP